MEFWVVKYLEIPFGDVSSPTQTDYYIIDIEFLGLVRVTVPPRRHGEIIRCWGQNEKMFGCECFRLISAFEGNSTM